jgi:hypothetical protein
VTAAAWVAGWCALSVPVALLVARGIRRMDPAPAEDAPDGTAGDLLDGIPEAVLSDAAVDEMFVRLVAPVAAEIDARKGSGL